ncbi:MAG: type II toxin-antitoxin system RelE/ParE family toxin [bacterium]
MKIKVLDEAEQDLLDGFRFYELQERELGDYFLDTISSDIDSLIIYAGIHAKDYGLYRLLSKRFPYAIYYSIQADVVFVNAVLDCRRNPDIISNRLTRDT